MSSTNNKDKYKPKAYGDRVDRILTHKISTARRLNLNFRISKENFKEIRKYSYNNKKDVEHADDTQIS